MDEVEQADAVAFVLAHVRGQETVISAMLRMQPVVPLFGATVGLLLRLLAEAGVDEAAVQATLADWQDRRRRHYAV